MDLLVTRPSSCGTFDVVLLDSELKNACGKVSAISVAHHCDPHAVFVHLSGDLTESERHIIENIVAAHEDVTGKTTSPADHVYG